MSLRSFNVDDKGDAENTLSAFRKVAEGLSHDEGIHLTVYTSFNQDSLRVVLSDALAYKIRSIYWSRWWYTSSWGEDPILDLLLNCPQLEELGVDFVYQSEIDFVSEALDRCPNIRNVRLTHNALGDAPRFCAALTQHKIEHLSIVLGMAEAVWFSDEMYAFLEADCLLSLNVNLSGCVLPPKLLKAMALCEQLVKMELTSFVIARGQDLSFPLSLKSLTLRKCTMVASSSWDLGYVRELRCFHVNSNTGESAVCDLSRVVDFTISNCNFVDDLLCDTTFEDVMFLVLYARLKEQTLKKIAKVLRVRNNALRALFLTYDAVTCDHIDVHIKAAINQPNCELDALFLEGRTPSDHARSSHLAIGMRTKRKIFTLLQGRLVRPTPNVLRNLPVDLFRVLGAMLM